MIKLSLGKFAKLAGLGAFGACAGLVLVYLGLIFFTRPMTGGGIDDTNAAVAWIALGGVILALIAVHVAIGKQLLRLGKGAGIRHEL
jgi:hypothetical protein